MKFRKTFFLLTGTLIAVIIIVSLIFIISSKENTDESETGTVSSEDLSTENASTVAPAPATPTIEVMNSEDEKVKYSFAEEERDSKLESAIIKEIGFTSDEDIKATRYYYNKVDLNDDGSLEIFVELVGPYTSGSGGDTGLIFTEADGEYKLLQRLTLVTNPIIISNHVSNGWHDIIINRTGGGLPSEQVLLRYNGTKYPNISDADPVPEGTAIEGLGIINNDIAKDFEEGKGLYLAP